MTTQKGTVGHMLTEPLLKTSLKFDRWSETAPSRRPAPVERYRSESDESFRRQLVRHVLLRLLLLRPCQGEWMSEARR